jgi:hypothetical protein
LQQRAAFPDRAGAGLVRHGPDVAADAGLVGLVGVPVDEPAVVICDEHLPLALRQLPTPDPHLAVLAEVALLAGFAEHVGTGIGRVGEHGVHRVVGRLDPGDLGAEQVGGRLQTET